MKQYNPGLPGLEDPHSNTLRYSSLSLKHPVQTVPVTGARGTAGSYVKA